MRSIFTINGHLSSQAEGGTAQINVGMGSTIVTQGKAFNFNVGGQSIGSGPPVEPPDLMATLYPILNGVPSTLFVQVSITAEANSPSDPRVASNNSASFDGDFSGSMHWGGIQDVEDATGHILTGWTVTSASGFDYTKPYSVPEAATSILLTQALVFCGVRRGRRIVK